MLRWDGRKKESEWEWEWECVNEIYTIWIVSHTCNSATLASYTHDEVDDVVWSKCVHSFVVVYVGWTEQMIWDDLASSVFDERGVCVWVSNQPTKWHGRLVSFLIEGKKKGRRKRRLVQREEGEEKENKK